MTDILDTNDIVPTDWVPENSIIKVIGVGGGGCNAVNYISTSKAVLSSSATPTSRCLSSVMYL